MVSKGVFNIRGMGLLTSYDLYDDPPPLTGRLYPLPVAAAGLCQATLPISKVSLLHMANPRYLGNISGKIW